MDTPTLHLQLTDHSGNKLADLENLPAPIHITPDGHIIIQDITPIATHACKAFTQAWQKACNETQPTQNQRA